jgi:hypothetical protein
MLCGVRLSGICLRQKATLCFGVANATRSGGAESENGEIPNKFELICEVQQGTQNTEPTGRPHKASVTRRRRRGQEKKRESPNRLFSWHCARAEKFVCVCCGDGRSECVTAHFGPKKRISGDTAAVKFPSLS